MSYSAPSNSTPLNVAVGDIDKDGDGDLYVSFFVDFKNFKSATYNVPEHAKTNLLLLNNGNLTFSDITESSNTNASLQNTFLSSFIDLDGDSWLDQIVAQNTGQVLKIFRNLKIIIPLNLGVKTGWGFSHNPIDINKTVIRIKNLISKIFIFKVLISLKKNLDTSFLNRNFKQWKNH